MRSTRKQPFCWQEKKVLRLLRANFNGADLAKLRNLYLTITEIDSDFNNEDINYFTKTISTYSGLSKDWIPTGLKIFEKLKMIEIVEERENGKFKGKKIVFTPENIDELGNSTVTVKSLNGKPSNGFLEPSEDILYQEDIMFKKNHDKDLKKAPDKTLDIFENLFRTFGINYTNTNQTAVKALLKTMSEKEVIEYLKETYIALKENKSIKSVARAFSYKIQKQERQVSTTKKEIAKEKKVEKVERPIILDNIKEEKVIEVSELEKIRGAVFMSLVSMDIVKNKKVELNRELSKLNTVKEIKEFIKKHDMELNYE